MSGTLAGTDDIQDRTAARIAEVGAFQQHMGIAKNYGQQVVKIVRYSARQHRDTFLLLRFLLPQPLVELPALGNVAGEDDCAALGREETERNLKRKFRAVLAKSREIGNRAPWSAGAHWQSILCVGPCERRGNCAG